MNTVLSLFVGMLSSILAALLLQALASRLNLLFPFRRILGDVRKLYHLIRYDRFDPEFIITVDRNSTIVGSILAGFFGFQTVIAIATVNTRLPDGTRQISISNAHLPLPELLDGKKILLLICFNDTGTSLETVYHCLSNSPFKIAEIRIAALYTSVSPKIKPRYSVLQIGKDVNTSFNRIIYKMPWMSKEWRHVLGEERLPWKR